MASEEEAGPIIEGGRVSRLRQNWAVHEDGALAERLQNDEFVEHYQGNRVRNTQIRADIPTAKYVQTKEEIEAQRKMEEYHRQLRDQEERDAAVARELERREREQRAYEAQRDEVFAKRIQKLEATYQHRGQPVVAQPSDGAPKTSPSSRRTPPLPMIPDGDVPAMLRTAPRSYFEETQEDVSFVDLRGGISYNDEQYLVKTARPAVVTAEPLYANNHPEHYAVSVPYPHASTGAISRIPSGAMRIPTKASPKSPNTSTEDEELSAAGISESDLAIAKQLEEQLMIAKRDEEIAKRLQEQMSLEEEFTGRRAEEIEAKDRQYAIMLQEKEKAKLKRAKERSKQKRRQRELDNADEIVSADDGAEDPLSSLEQDPRRPESQQSNDHRSHSRQSRQSAGRRSAGPDKSFDSGESVAGPLPARRPYVHHEAIDNYESTMQEPQYANIGPNGQPIAAHSRQPSVLDDDNIPVPPYMPMQHQNSKKCTSLEKRINKKKEKEGCKQQ